MLPSPTLPFAPAATRGPAGPTRSIGTPRELTNGAPCLGLTIAAAGMVWAGLGSALAFLIL